MKKKNAVYQLIDNYTLFYYQFLKNKPSDERFWSNQINMPQINTWQGLAFERVCLEHISEIKSKLGISGVQTDVNSWYCTRDVDKGINGSQIDLLIVRRDQVINLCEIKFSNSDFNITKTKYAIYPTLITTYGMVQNSYSGNIQSVITLKDLFT